MNLLRNSHLRSAMALLAAAWILVVALCPPMFRMHCLVTGRTVISLYAPEVCMPQKDMPAEHSVSPQCCEFSKIAPANDVYEPLALVYSNVLHLAIPVVLAMEPMLPRLDRPLRSYNGHAPPRSLGLDAQAGLGVFRI